MLNVRFPYGKEYKEHTFSNDELKAVLTSDINDYVPESGETELIEKALGAPVGSESLCEMSRGKKNIVIIASDHTRSAPSIPMQSIPATERATTANIL